jgi:DNA-binding MarR family transcriptional regulator
MAKERLDAILDLSETKKAVLFGARNGDKNIDIAEELDLSPSWVSQIKAELEEKDLLRRQ